jgi:hypothetical protein
LGRGFGGGGSWGWPWYGYGWPYSTCYLTPYGTVCPQQYAVPTAFPNAFVGY